MKKKQSDSTKVSIIKKDKLQDAAVIVISTSKHPYEFNGDSLKELHRICPKGCLVCFLKQGDNMFAFNETEMNENGWFKKKT